MIYVIEDDEIFANIIAGYIKKNYEVKIFHDALSAINAISEDHPNLIFLDILLTGPDGFTFLNELVSYEDTAKIPIVIISSLEIKEDLSDYGVVKILNKDVVMPQDIREAARQYAE